MVKAVREAEKSIGVVNYSLTQKQVKGKCFSRSLYVVKNIKKGEVITSVILEENNLDYKNFNLKIKTLLKKTTDEIKLRGSIANEITTRGDFIKKMRDSLQINQNIKYQ